MALFYSSVPLSHGSVTVIQHVWYQDPDTYAAKWNSARILFFMPELFQNAKMSSVEKVLYLSVFSF